MEQFLTVGEVHTVFQLGGAKIVRIYRYLSFQKGKLLQNLSQLSTLLFLADLAKVPRSYGYKSTCCHGKECLVLTMHNINVQLSSAPEVQSRLSPPPILLCTLKWRIACKMGSA